MNKQNHGVPIYNKLYYFLKNLYGAVHNMSHEYKFDIGRDMLDLSWKCLDDVFMANQQLDENKLEFIQNLSLNFDKLKLRLRMAQEVRIVTTGQFEHWQCTWLLETGSMIGGWLKWAQEKTDVHVQENLPSLS